MGILYASQRESLYYNIWEYMFYLILFSFTNIDTLISLYLVFLRVLIRLFYSITDTKDEKNTESKR